MSHFSDSHYEWGRLGWSCVLFAFEVFQFLVEHLLFDFFFPKKVQSNPWRNKTPKTDDARESEKKKLKHIKLGNLKLFSSIKHDKGEQIRIWSAQWNSNHLPPQLTFNHPSQISNHQSQHSTHSIQHPTHRFNKPKHVQTQFRQH